MNESEFSLFLVLPLIVLMYFLINKMNIYTLNPWGRESYFRHLAGIQPEQFRNADVSHLDREKLMRWFFDRGKLYKEKALLNVKFFFGFSLVMPTTTTLVILISLLFPDYSPISVFDDLHHSGMLYSYIFPAFLFAFYSMTKSRKLQVSNYKELRRGQFAEVWKCVHELTMQLSIQNKSVRIFYVPTDQFAASIIEKKGEIALFLSRAMISLSGSDPQKFRAILAHELAHVQLKDNMGGIALRSVSAFYVVFTLVLNLFVLLTEGSFLLFIGNSVIMLNCYFTLQKVRRYSEHLADTFALACGSGTKIFDIIIDFTQDNKSLSYPSKNERLVFLQKAINGLSGEAQSKNARESHRRATGATIIPGTYLYDNMKPV